MKKAQGPLLMIIVLLALMVIIIFSLTFSWARSIEKQVELRFKEDLYVISNSLKLGKLYLDTSLDYSVYQAMYDVGKNGGWETKKNNLNDNRDEVKNSLKKRISQILKNYVDKNYNFLGEVIRLPLYEESGITVDEVVDSNLYVSAEGERNVYFEEKVTVSMEKKSIRLGISSNLERIYDSKFFQLYDKAADVLKDVTDCNDKKETSGDYEIALNASNSTKPCNVSVSVTDVSKEFPVFNGTDVAFEPIAFEFLVKIA